MMFTHVWDVEASLHLIDLLIKVLEILLMLRTTNQININTMVVLIKEW